MLALPFGSRGGNWGDEALAELREKYTVRDVRFTDSAASEHPAALEIDNWLGSFVVAPGRDNYFYAHGNHSLSDDKFCKFVQWVVDLRKAGIVEVF